MDLKVPFRLVYLVVNVIGFNIAIRLSVIIVMRRSLYCYVLIGSNIRVDTVTFWNMDAIMVKRHIDIVLCKDWRR